MKRVYASLRTLRAFVRAKSANVAMMFALSLLPLAIAAGAGLDYAQAMMVRAKMLDALDAAALAVGGQPGLSQTDANTLARNVFKANYKGEGSPDITPVIKGQSVSVTASDQVPTTSLALVGKNFLTVQATSFVVWGQTKMWVSLVLDNTGSMSQADSTNLTKMAALIDASHKLLDKLKAAATSPGTSPGDVKVAIVPFAKDVNVGISNVNASWIDWSDWNVQYSTAPSSSVGAGSTCPWSTGIKCISGPGSTQQVSKVPSSGLICPDAVSGGSTGQTGHYYDGCYNSIQQNKVTVTTAATPVTDKQTCKSVKLAAATCTSNSGYPSNGTVNSSSTVSYTPNYTGDSSSATAPAISNSNTVDGSSSCSNGSTNCSTGTKTWTRTITYTSTVVTTAKTASGIYDHAWVINDHSVWRGCVMDRTQNDDTAPTIPGAKFPAEQNDSCNVATVMPLSYDWDALNAKIDTMKANGGTNQTIGLAHGMQVQTADVPYNAPGLVLPPNTTRYIILLSDGLNTLDRWYGDGSNQSTQVDGRMAKACQTAKDQGFVIYTLFVDLGGTQGNSAVLKSCASDNSKYYDLTTSAAIVTAFNDIAQKITNLRVAS